MENKSYEIELQRAREIYKNENLHSLADPYESTNNKRRDYDNFCSDFGNKYGVNNHSKKIEIDMLDISISNK